VFESAYLAHVADDGDNLDAGSSPTMVFQNELVNICQILFNRFQGYYDNII